MNMGPSNNADFQGYSVHYSSYWMLGDESGLMKL